MVATSGALPARAALLSLRYPPEVPEGICSNATWMVSCVLLNASTTSWLPRSADQNVMVVLPLVPDLLVLCDALSFPLQALRAPVRGSAVIAASTDRRLCRPGMGASRGSCVFESRES